MQLLPSILSLPLTLGLTLSACDSKDGDGDKKAAAADKKGGEAKPDDVKADAKEGATPETKEEAPKDPEPPKMEPLALEPWGVTLQVPAGAKPGDFEDGEGVTADTVEIDAEEGCEVTLELYRHAKSPTGLEDMFKNATGPSGNKDDQFPVKEKTDDGYEVKHSWVIPLGDTMWAVEVGKVLGDHLYLCGAGTLMGVEKPAAECAFAACQTLALTGG